MVKAWPVLASDEFADACHQLEANASGRLDGTNWLSLQWDEKGALHIKKQFQIEERERRNDEVETDGEGDVIEFEDASTLRRLDPPSTIIVDFSITMSPTYQVPMLWFVFTRLPRAGPQGIDGVYRYLVPIACKAQVGNMGVMGGISIANHPISDIPAFFVHPCNTHEALLTLQISNALSPYRYLLLWLGLIGPAVGLYMPSQLVSLDP